MTSSLPRVAVFIDYQNVYMRAREAFGLYGSFVDGQIQPRLTGLALARPRESDPPRNLVSVRVYRGTPSSRFDNHAYSACMRQVALWQQQAPVMAITRPLNYSQGVPREKGIDVALAVDFVMMAQRDEYDVGIIFSGDTDLVPALEAVVALKGPEAVETAAWAPLPPRNPIVIRVPGKNTKVHHLPRAYYLALHDPTNYTKQRRRR